MGAFLCLGRSALWPNRSRIFSILYFIIVGRSYEMVRRWVKTVSPQGEAIRGQGDTIRGQGEAISEQGKTRARRGN